MNELIVGASTSSCIKLIHRLTARCEKKNNRESWQLLVFANFQLWPLVILFSTRVKKWNHETAENPLIILNISIKSARFRRSSSDHSFNLTSRFLYGRSFNSGNMRVNRCWTLQQFKTIFRVIRAPYNWIVFGMRSDKRFIQRYQNCWILECNRSSYETEDLVSFRAVRRRHFADAAAADRNWSARRRRRRRPSVGVAPAPFSWRVHVML